VMRLLENIRGTKSSPRTIATAMAFGVKIKKVGNLSSDIGQIVNPKTIDRKQICAACLRQL